MFELSIIRIGLFSMRARNTLESSYNLSRTPIRFHAIDSKSSRNEVGIVHFEKDLRAPRPIILSEMSPCIMVADELVSDIRLQRTKELYYIIYYLNFYY